MLKIDYTLSCALISTFLKILNCNQKNISSICNECKVVWLAQTSLLLLITISKFWVSCPNFNHASPNSTTFLKITLNTSTWRIMIHFNQIQSKSLLQMIYKFPLQIYRIPRLVSFLDLITLSCSPFHLKLRNSRVEADKYFLV